MRRPRPRPRGASATPYCLLAGGQGISTGGSPAPQGRCREARMRSRGVTAHPPSQIRFRLDLAQNLSTFFIQRKRNNFFMFLYMCLDEI